ncbi:MAG: response regulator [Bacteroidales bacterium]|jgi:DNA-binding response OmpR family regulator|nr:response regulator [Bacteroidales bacterium]MDI9553423.1 response regulator [Bacteroidota bacterium]MBP7037444.1 response regulator [Bacteroidales bacterium]MZP64681.1 response regulator [Bacteroidales bacterium]NLK55372.1 response regulator [Bacteroidales bacterium]
MPVILIIEDDRDLREMLRSALLRKDYTVLEADNGKEALINFKPGVTDLVVTDLLMPEEDGLKVIMQMREMKPEIKVIAISGGGKAGPGSYLRMAKALGADSVFPKPFSVNDLVTRIDDLLHIEQ